MSCIFAGMKDRVGARRDWQPFFAESDRSVVSEAEIPGQVGNDVVRLDVISAKAKFFFGPSLN